MYAIIQTGGKQYRAKVGEIIQIEKLPGDVGAPVKFDQVLFWSAGDGDNSQIALGAPVVTNAAVEGEIVGQGRGEKVHIIKMKRRKQYRRFQGHRQEQTQVLITAVDNGAGKKDALTAEAKKTRMESFQSYLAPRGLAHTPKTLGSRVRLKIEAGVKSAEGEKKVTRAPKPKKHAAPKKGKKAKKAVTQKKKAAKKKASKKKSA